VRGGKGELKIIDNRSSSPDLGAQVAIDVLEMAEGALHILKSKEKKRKRSEALFRSRHLMCKDEGRRVKRAVVIRCQAPIRKRKKKTKKRGGIQKREIDEITSYCSVHRLVPTVCW
jgi:hypothetical protein